MRLPVPSATRVHGVFENRSAGRQRLKPVVDSGFTGSDWQPVGREGRRQMLQGQREDENAERQPGASRSEVPR